MQLKVGVLHATCLAPPGCCIAAPTARALIWLTHGNAFALDAICSTCGLGVIALTLEVSHPGGVRVDWPAVCLLMVVHIRVLYQ